MNARSWAESIRITQNEKLTNIAPPVKVIAEQRHNIHDRKHYRPRGIGLNPLTQKYNDPVKEATITHEQYERTIIKGNIGRDNQLKQLQDHNIINKLPYVQPPPPSPPKEISRTFASGAPFHIFSGDPLPPELQSDAAKAYRPTRPLLNYAPSLARRRAMDILSNKYLVDDEGKTQRDAKDERDRALRRYWQTHNFDPLTQTYYDPDKEQAAREITELSKTVQGVAQRNRLPTSLRISTGAAYDIVHHVTKDPDVLNTVDLMDTRGLRIRTRLQTEERQHSAGEATAGVAYQRQIQRMRQRRYEEFFDPRGYNVITNQSRDNQVLENNLAGREVRSWDRITRDLQSAPATL